MRRGRRRARPALRRPPPRARGHVAPGVRRAAPGRPHGVRRPDLTVATMDHNVPDDRHRPARPRPDLGQADGGARRELRRVRHPTLSDGRAGSGHRARDRARAGSHATGHDDRVRRQPHRRPTARSARWRSASARARSSTCSPPRPCRRPCRARWRSPSTARCPPASPPRTSSSRSSAGSAPAAGSARSSSTAGRRSARSRWKGRMTVCNMSIEAGARAGLVAPDDTTFAYLEGREFAPKGAAWERALDDWRSLVTDAGATFDEEIVLDAAALRPTVTWGTNPAQSVTIDDVVPSPDSFEDRRLARRRAARARVHGPQGGHADARDRRRHRVHRLVHQLADRGPPRRGRGGAGPHGARPACARWWCPARWR